MLNVLLLLVFCLDDDRTGWRYECRPQPGQCFSMQGRLECRVPADFQAQWEYTLRCPGPRCSWHHQEWDLEVISDEERDGKRKW